MKAGLKNLIYISLLLMLQACGGGGTLTRDGGGTTTPPTSSVTYSVSLDLVSSITGDPANQLSASEPLTVKATVTRSDGKSTAGMVVDFSLDDDTLATFSVQNGRAVVDDNGVATINLLVGDQSGAGNVIATVNTDVSTQVAFTSSGSSQQAVQPATLEFYASSLQLASSGKDQIELIALVKNASNGLMSGVPVSFSADNDASLSASTATTDADGTARVMLSTVNNPENRAINITATTGSSTILTQTLQVQVVGTEVQINGPDSVILGDSAPVTVKLVNSDGEGIANKPVTLSLDNQLGTLSSTSVTTDSDGNAQVTYTANTAGTDTLSASALGASGQFPLTVREDLFNFTNQSVADVPLNTPVTLTIDWQKNGVAYAGGAVSFNTSRGTITSSSTTTDANGKATVTLQADNAGGTLLTANGTDSSGNTVSARVQFEFIATTAYSILVDATPDSVGPNGQTSTVTAVVRDANDNLVKGKTVNFQVDDASGGTISANSGVTDSRGIASTVFTSNAVNSNGAKVWATVADTPSVTNNTVISVADRAFDISLGTGRIVQSPDDATYLKEFAVFVSDSDGNPVANVDLSVSLKPVKYNQGGGFNKGYWNWNDTLSIWQPIQVKFCPNEDVNDNGILDKSPVDEDTNHDGSLTPGIIGTATFKGNNSTTDANGQATIEYRYPKALAPWTDVVINVSGSSAGSESAQNQKFTLVVAADDVKDKGSPPPPNPFGMGANCTDTN